ncbi:hypothetical protein BU14_0245s0007 [Porphyra umbilicalis]|uniref:Uncharacterized protein n=1 Tax=Porphyra umbilicalis TaxID=2786 RepID=A0A1X6P388_PORUM|nr:hypothetical protein BU14_0245s0007 [Porphyra umbilicalis]|eukprot:OSX75225.1 hypothetical protein BU14_0245s0007 [Porphyra umbilicalis]
MAAVAGLMGRQQPARTPPFPPHLPVFWGRGHCMAPPPPATRTSPSTRSWRWRWRLRRRWKWRQRRRRRLLRKWQRQP